MLKWEPVEGTDYLRAVGKRNVYFVEELAWAYLEIVEVGVVIKAKCRKQYYTIDDAKKAAEEMEQLK